MKKIYFLIVATCLFALIATPLMAATQTVVWSDAESARKITDGTGGGSGLTKIGLSPNVTIYYNSNADGSKFEVAGQNSKGKFEYGVCADDNNVYMHDMDSADSGTNTPVTDLTGDGSVVTTWVLMGGS